MKRRRLGLLLLLCAGVSGLSETGAAADGAVPYLFPASAGRAPDDLSMRFPAPAGAQRVDVPARSFGAWLRHLPLLPAQSPVLLYTGARKPRQDVHAAVVDIDVPRRDLQQCADAVMRLRAEYLYAAGRPGDIVFHPDPGKPRALRWQGGADRAGFQRYLIRVFAEAGSASLQAELPVATGPVQPGDVLIQGGYPGHAVIVLDVAQDAAGRRLVLIGQSYMPAQQLHVLVNRGDAGLSPWYDAAALDTAAGLQTPEWWRPFVRRDVRRFRD